MDQQTAGPARASGKRGRVAMRAAALVMAASVALAACGGGKSSSTPTSQASAPTATTAASPAASASPTVAATPTEATGEPITVDALWFGQDTNGDPTGGTSAVKVTVRKKSDSELRVGFFESEVGGTGDQWRAAGWMAVVTSSLLLGKDPSSYEFSYDVAGRIDGPSAGALMTIATLAGYLGDTVKPDVTMTGTINPDGTIGPVGGIPHKLEGAAKKGKKIVLVPAGERYDYDYKLKQPVDLVEAGKKLDVDVQLVSDVYQAYQFLTGHELPRMDASGPKPAFPQQAFDKLRASATNWYGTYEEQRGRFTALPAEIQKSRKGVIDLADGYAEKAQSALKQGEVAVAYQNAINAAASARFAAQAGELDNIYVSQGLEPLVERLKSAAAAETRMNGVLEQLKAQTPRTATDAVALMDAYSSLAVAQGLVAQAEGAIEALQNNEDATEDDVLNAVYAAAYDYAFADVNLELAKDALANGVGFGKAPAPKPELLKAMSETLRRGAEANIKYFETLIINPWAEENGVHPDLAKLAFMSYDSDYTTAVAASVGGENLAAGITEPEKASSLTLGSALTAYAYSATLVAKYYALGAQLDENANVTGYDRSSALADMLDLADKRADEMLRVVSAEEPVSALMYYENARISRQGDASEQLGALNYYWQSAILSELLGIFSGQIGQ